jgi:hypothetical protein
VLDLVDTEPEQVVHGGPQAESRGDVALPQLEPARVRPQLVAVRAGPFGTVQVDDRRFQRADQIRANVEETRAARAAQPLTAGPGQRIHAEFGDVDAKLPDGLAGVEQDERALIMGEPDDLSYRVHQSPVGGYMHQRHDARPLVEQAGKGIEIDLARRVAGHHLDDSSAGPRALQRGHRIARVLDAGQQDPIARLQRDRVEHLGPGPGGGVGQRDGLRRGAQQRPERDLDPGQVLGTLARRLVSADFRLAPQMPGHHVQHGRRWQRRPGTVQENPTGGAGGVGGNAFPIHGHTSVCRTAVTKRKREIRTPRLH